MGDGMVSLRLTEASVPARRLWLAGAVVVLNLVDVLLTKAVLHHGGVEANPVMASLMDGFAAPLGLKMVIAGTAGILLLLCPPEAKLGERAVTAVVALYSAIVAWNVVILALQALR